MFQSKNPDSCCKGWIRTWAQRNQKQSGWRQKTWNWGCYCQDNEST